MAQAAIWGGRIEKASVKEISDTQTNNVLNFSGFQ
jgi:hypothetical protein